MEQPWNSVQIKFNVTREAADKLKALVNSDDSTLRELGILAVQIDNDRLVKLNLSNDRATTAIASTSTQSTPSSASSDVLKRNDTLTKLLERSTPSTSLPFIVNNKRIDNLISVQPQPSIVHHHTIASNSQQPQQQNDIVDRQLAYLNQNASSKLPNINIKIHQQQSQQLTPSQQSNDETLNRLQINSANQTVVSHQSIGTPTILNHNNNKNVQTFTYVNMQQHQAPLNQMNLNQSSIGQTSIGQTNNSIISSLSNSINNNVSLQTNHQLNNNNQLNSQMNNQLNKSIVCDKTTVKVNTLVNNLNSSSNKISIGTVQQQQQQIQQQLQQQPTASNIPTQNVVQQIQLKYPSTQSISTQISQPNTTMVTNSTNLNMMNNNNNIVSVKQPFVRNPNIKINTNQLNSSNNSNNNQPSLALNSPLTSQPNSSASNVALTSPLLVNLLQSDVNDHYSSNSTHLSLSNTTLSNSTTNSNSSNNNTGGPLIGNVLPILKETPIKEPPAKKAKTKKTRKPKDKPPDQVINQTSSIALNNCSSSLVSNNEINTVNTSPSIQPQYSNTIVNSSIITIPTSVTLSTAGTSSIQIQKQPINNVVTTNPYQQAQFVSPQQQTNSFSTNQFGTTSNSSMIVNQIKLTNSADIVQHPVNNQITNNNQLNSCNLENSFTSQVLTNQSPQHQQPLNSLNNNNMNKTTITPAIQNSSNYFQKLSSLTKEQVQSSNSNMIVQNATIVNSTIVNTSTITLNEQSPFSSIGGSINSTNNNPIIPHKNSDAFLNLPSPSCLEQNKPTKHLINPFTGELELMTSDGNNEEESDNLNCSMQQQSVCASNSISTNSSDLNQNNSNSINNISPLTSSFSSSLSSSVPLLISNHNFIDRHKETNHLSDTDSGISKSTNDASSQSSTEISPVELLNNQDHKLNETTLLNSQSSLVHFNHNESMIGESTILKNKLVNDMLTTSSQDSGLIGNKRSNDSDQIDEYFTDLSDYHTLNSDHSLVSDSNATTNNLLQSSSSNLLGNDISSHSELNVNDFLTTPDLNDQLITSQDQQPNLDGLEHNSLESNSIVGDHNYTNSGDHTYTNVKRCAFNSTTGTGNNSTTSNMCSNKIKKVNS